MSINESAQAVVKKLLNVPKNHKGREACEKIAEYGNELDHLYAQGADSQAVACAFIAEMARLRLAIQEGK